MTIENKIDKLNPLTLGQTIDLAEEYDIDVSDVVIKEAEIQLELSREEVLELVMKEYEHNLDAIDIGVTSGESLLFAKSGKELKSLGNDGLFKDKFINDILTYSIGAQVGNHTVGLNPCAGTGDPCVYSGYIKAMYDNNYKKEEIEKIAALMLKIGSMFRVGKISTGCNMEGFGAGVTAVAAASTELLGGTPREMEKAMVLAISPTIAVPCTPRVMVPALCATHLGGAVLIGHMSAGMAIKTNIEVNVPIDVMLAMATEVHPISAEHIVPTVVDYMNPFFKTDKKVEDLIDEDIKEYENKSIEKTLKKAEKVAKDLADNSRPITNTLGDAVVGGSSQAVGSPTNTARIAHELFKDKDDIENIKRIKIELYPELFARRGINIPGIIMGAVFGASTSDGKMYQESIDLAKEKGIEIEIVKIDEHQGQRITIESDKEKIKVEALNRGGGRLVLKSSSVSLEKAKEKAEKLGIVLVEA